jgi:hypothetical protein
MHSEQAVRVRALNDQLRLTGRGGRVLITQAILHQGDPFLQSALAALREFHEFTDGNDPYQEHDFGSFKVGDQTLFFKIDYYDPFMAAGAEDPADPYKCVRVLTLMLSSDY